MTAETDPAAASAPTLHWFEALRAGRLIHQICDCCEAVVYYPRVVCPDCGAGTLTFADSSGHGTVYATTAVHTRSGAHNVALIDVDEGFRMMSSVREIDPDDVEIGMRVELRIIEEEDRPLPIFLPSAATEAAAGPRAAEGAA